MRRVLITGASRGIGRAIAEKYRKEGWETLTPTREQLNIENSWSIQDFIENLQSLDVLINNAAINKSGNLFGYLDHYVANVQSANWLIEWTHQFLAVSHCPRVVNISSCHSLLGKSSKKLLYAESKAALDAATRCFAAEYAREGILVNSVAPGFVDTDMTRQNLSPQEIETITNDLPIKRLARPEEIAELVYFLGSEKNTYITGQTIAIDGGYTTCR